MQTPPTEETPTERRIRSFLERELNLDADSFWIEGDDESVILQGTVPSSSDRRRLENYLLDECSAFVESCELRVEEDGEEERGRSPAAMHEDWSEKRVNTPRRQF